MVWAKKVTVIMPCYKSIQNIRKSYESMGGQLDQNFEILCIYDSGYKATSNFLRKLSRKNKNINLLPVTGKQNNREILTKIINSASGDYFLFLDSGDFTTQNWVGALVRKAIISDADLIFGDIRTLRKGKRESEATYRNLDPVRLQNFDSDGRVILNQFLKMHGLSPSYHSPWNKLIRRDLMECCQNDMSMEPQFAQQTFSYFNLIFALSLFCNAKHVVNLHDQYYYEHPKEDRLSNFDPDIFSNAAKKILTKHNCWEQYKAEVSFLLQNCFHSEQETYTNQCFKSLETKVQPIDSVYQKLIKQIYSEDYKIICFNIFDTLIVRPFVPPADIFTLLNVPFQRIFALNAFVDFAEQRRSAEVFCRKNIKANQNIAINDIYDFLSLNYGYDRDKLSQIQALELENEIKYTYPRECLVDLLNQAAEAGKKVVLASESYLPRECIEQILKKCGISGVDHLFLSNELDSKVFKTKFAAILGFYKDSGIQARQILHIGDDAFFDIELARQAGFSTYLCPSTTELFQGDSASIYTGKAFSKIYKIADRYTDMEHTYRGCTGLRCVNAVIANKIFDCPFQSFNLQSDLNGDPRYIGYYLLGTHIFAVALWLIKNIRNKNIRTVHFAARDGYLIQKAYEILAKGIDGAPKSNYIRISRKAFAITDIKCKEDMHSLAEKMNVCKQSPDSVYALFLPVLTQESKDRFESFRNQNKDICQKVFENREEFEKYALAFYQKYLKDADFSSYHARLSEYFQNIIQKNDVFFDIGYSGRVESALQGLLGFKIQSYYIHTNNDSIFRRQAFTPFENKTFYHHKPNVTGVMREHFLSEMCPSTIGYIKNGNGIQLQNDAYHINESTYFSTKIMQESALEFVSDMIRIFGSAVFDLYCREEDLSKPFEYYLHYSCAFDRQIFSNLECEDDLGEGHNLSGLRLWNETLERVSLTGGHELNDNPAISYNIRKASRWKRALYFFMFEPEVFRQKVKKNIRKK